MHKFLQSSGVVPGAYQIPQPQYANLCFLTLCLKLHAIDLHAENEFGVWHSPLDFVDDLQNNPTSILQRPSVFIRAQIGGLAEKLCQKVAMGTMDLRILSNHSNR